MIRLSVGDPNPSKVRPPPSQTPKQSGHTTSSPRNRLLRAMPSRIP